MVTQKKSKKKSTKKVSQKTSKKRQLSQKMRMLLASAFLFGFVVVCLFALVAMRANFLPDSQSGSDLVYEEPPEEIQPLKIYSYVDIYQLIENQLINGPDSIGWRLLPERQNIQVRKVFGDFPPQAFLAELAAHIEQANSSAQLKVSRTKGIIHLYWQNNLRLELRYQVPATLRRERGKIAVIMDDMGSSMTTLRTLLQLDIVITPSILPGTRQALAATSFLQDRDREYMIHMPMQPRSYPRTNPGENALLLGQSESETRQLVRRYIAAIPGAVGGNNHMGSRYTEVAEAMRIVLSELQQSGLFFVDSRTIGDSVAFSEARRMGMKTATRNIFLDNKDDVTYIRKQIRKMVGMAGDNQEIIAICHPHAVTLEAFQLEQRWLQQQSVDFVAASELVHSY